MLQGAKKAICFVLFAASCACGQRSDSSTVASVADSQSITARSDGLFDVVCRSGAHEIASSAQISTDQICLVAPLGSLNILSMQLRADGQYDVICSNNTRVVASSEEIRTTDVCSPAPTPTPIPAGAPIRIVLTWGNAPTDLDAHLFANLASGSTFHASYLNIAGLNVRLDVDDTSSFGPETVTIQTLLPGHYSYGVNDYSSRGDTPGRISSSAARVQIYEDQTLLSDFQPTNSGQEKSWHVFDVDITLTGAITVTPVNTYSDVNLDNVASF